MAKKTWKNPGIITLSAKELSRHIKAAARSTACTAGVFK